MVALASTAKSQLGVTLTLAMTLPLPEAPPEEKEKEVVRAPSPAITLLVKHAPHVPCFESTRTSQTALETLIFERIHVSRTPHCVFVPVLRFHVY